MLKIVADHNIPFLRGVLEPFANLTYLPGAEIANSHLLDADALMVRTRTRCNDELLRNTKVRFIASATIGHDHIDKDYCHQNGISWANAPGCNAASVVQYMASSLAVYLNKKGKRFNEITLGIVGAGNVGQRLANMCTTLGISTLINDPPREQLEGSCGFHSLADTIQNSDIVSFHVPLTLTGSYKTHHLANEQLLAQMKPGAWLINTARGEVVQTRALKDLLRKGILGGAILDVWENEPSIDFDLLQLATIATPHIAGYSADGKANGTAMSVQALSRFFRLGIDHWRPDYIPPAPEGIIVPTNSESKEQLFCDISMKAYNILEDHQKLSTQPAQFETLREDYPVRREVPGHLVKGDILTDDSKKLLVKLGYHLL